MGGSCKSSEGQSTRDFIRHAGAGAAAGWLFFQLLFNLQLSVFSGFHSNFNLSLIAVSAKVFFFFHFLSILTCHFFSGFHLNYATFHCVLFLSAIFLARIWHIPCLLWKYYILVCVEGVLDSVACLFCVLQWWLRLTFWGLFIIVFLSCFLFLTF